MPLVGKTTKNQYANNYKDSELISFFLSKLEPEISAITRCHLDPDVVNEISLFDPQKYQNACIYVSYTHQGRFYSLLTLNKNGRSIMTPGGRRDRDHGLVYTALVEMQEETGLLCDTITALVPEALFHPIGTTLFEGPRGPVKHIMQMHAYNLWLGELSPEQISEISKGIKGGDDVEFAEFKEIPFVINQADGTIIAPIQMTGAKNPVEILPVVAQNLLRIAQNPITPNATLFRDVFAQMDSNQNKLAALVKLVVSCPLEQTATRNQYVRNLFMAFTVADIQVYIDALPEKTNMREPIKNIVKEVCQLSLPDFNSIKTQYEKTKEKSTQTPGSKKHIEDLKSEKLSDFERFKIAQEYMLEHSHRELARCLRKQLLRNEASKAGLHLSVTRNTPISSSCSSSSLSSTQRHSASIFVPASSSSNANQWGAKFEGELQYEQVFKLTFYPLDFSEKHFPESKLSQLQELIKMTETLRSIDYYDYRKSEEILGCSIQKIEENLKKSLEPLGFHVLKTIELGDILPSIQISRSDKKPLKDTSELMALLRQEKFIPMDEYDNQPQSKLKTP